MGEERQGGKAVKIRWIDPPKEVNPISILFLDKDGEIPAKLLRELGVEQKEGESRLAAWLRWNAEQNGVTIEEVRAAVNDIVNYDFSEEGNSLKKFIWIIA